MSVTELFAYTCDYTGCTSSFTGTTAAAGTAGWTYAAAASSVNSLPAPTVRCPNHVGQ